MIPTQPKGLPMPTTWYASPRHCRHHEQTDLRQRPHALAHPMILLDAALRSRRGPTPACVSSAACCSAVTAAAARSAASRRASRRQLKRDVCQERSGQPRIAPLIPPCNQCATGAAVPIDCPEWLWRSRCGAEALGAERHRRKTFCPMVCTDPRVCTGPAACTHTTLSGTGRMASTEPWRCDKPHPCCGPVPNACASRGRSCGVHRSPAPEARHPVAISDAHASCGRGPGSPEVSGSFCSLAGSVLRSRKERGGTRGGGREGGKNGGREKGGRMEGNGGRREGEGREKGRGREGEGRGKGGRREGEAVWSPVASEGSAALPCIAVRLNLKQHLRSGQALHQR